MAENIDISAVARVIDLASGPLKAIQGVIGGVASAATAASSAFTSLGGVGRAAFGGMAGAFKGAAGEVAGFGKQIAGMFGPLQGLAGLAGLAGMTAAVTSFIAQCQQLDKASQALHLSTDALQAFQNAAGGPEAANTALTNLQKTLGVLKAGGKDADSVGDLLHRMGVSAKEIAEGNLDVILPKLADSFQKNAGSALSAKAAIALFGEEVGPKLLPFLQKGSVGIAELAREAARLGISVADLRAGLEAGKAMDELGKSVTRAKNAVAAAILPAFVPMVKAVTDFVNANKELLGQVALPAFLGLLTTSLISLGVAITGALGPWGLLVGAIVAGSVAIYQNWDKVKAFFDSSLPGFLPALQEAGAGIAAWAKNSSAAITAGFQTGGISGGLAAVWDVFKTGADNAITWITAKFSGIDWAAIGTAAAQLMWQGMTALFNAEVSLGQMLLDRFNQVDWKQLGISVLNGLASMWSQAGDLLAGLRGLDWKSVGAFVGRVFVDTLLLVFVELPSLLANIFAGADWSAIGAGLLKYFTELVKTIFSIGVDLIAGLIDGMLSKIPGLSVVVDKAKAILSGIGDAWNSVKNTVGTAVDEALSAKTGADIRGGIGRPSLLQQPGATGGGERVVKSDVGIKVITPPGARVETTTTGAPINVETGAHQAGMAVP
jgi:hypothetical protein